jgi:hypothetical protein
MRHRDPRSERIAVASHNQILKVVHYVSAPRAVLITGGHPRG